MARLVTPEERDSERLAAAHHAIVKILSEPFSEPDLTQCALRYVLDSPVIRPSDNDSPMQPADEWVKRGVLVKLRGYRWAKGCRYGATDPCWRVGWTADESKFIQGHVVTANPFTVGKDPELKVTIKPTFADAPRDGIPVEKSRGYRRVKLRDVEPW